jgi:hypothetical protein
MSIKIAGDLAQKAETFYWDMDMLRLAVGMMNMAAGFAEDDGEQVPGQVRDSLDDLKAAVLLVQRQARRLADLAASCRDGGAVGAGDAVRQAADAALLLQSDFRILTRVYAVLREAAELGPVPANVAKGINDFAKLIALAERSLGALCAGALR